MLIEFRPTESLKDILAESKIDIIYKDLFINRDTLKLIVDNLLESDSAYNNLVIVKLEYGINQSMTTTLYGLSLELNLNDAKYNGLIVLTSFNLADVCNQFMKV